MGGRQQECRLDEIRPARECLQGRIWPGLGADHHAERIASARTRTKHIDLEISRLVHGVALAMAANDRRNAPVRSCHLEDAPRIVYLMTQPCQNRRTRPGEFHESRHRDDGMSHVRHRRNNAARSSANDGGSGLWPDTRAGRGQWPQARGRGEDPPGRAPGQPGTKVRSTTSTSRSTYRSVQVSASRSSWSFTTAPTRPRASSTPTRWMPRSSHQSR